MGCVGGAPTVNRRPNRGADGLDGAKDGGTRPPIAGHSTGIPTPEPLATQEPTRRARDTLSSKPLPRRLCSIEEASAYLGLSTWTVRRMVWTGALPHIRSGRRILLDLWDLEAWITREKVQGV